MPCNLGCHYFCSGLLVREFHASRFIAKVTTTDRISRGALLLGTLIGSAALLWVAAADSLETLIAAQMLAGGAWGAVFTTGVSSALGLGTSGREGLVLGLLFTMLSLATLTRAGLVAGGIKASPEYIETL